MKQMIWISRESDGNNDAMYAYFDEEQARKDSEYAYNHLTESERKRTTVSVEGYEVEIDEDDDRPAGVVVSDMLNDDTFPYDPIFYDVIEE